MILSSVDLEFHQTLNVKHVHMYIVKMTNHVNLYNVHRPHAKLLIVYTS